MNIRECVDRWLDTILELLLAMGLIALRDQDNSYRRPRSPGLEFRLVENNGQMLLPGIAEPRWWEFGRKG